MKTLLYFECEPERTPESLRYVFFGRYSRTGFLFVRDGEIVLFGTCQGATFYRQVLPLEEPASSYDFLLLPVATEEGEKLYETCDACARSNIPFNLVDLLLIHVPFREVEDLSLFNAPTLNNAQATILLLRECLLPGSRLRGVAEALHSRLTFVESIFDAIRPHATPVFWSGLVRLAGVNGLHGAASLRN